MMTMTKRRNRRVPFVFFGSFRLSNRVERRRVRDDLRRGIEPSPKYATGKFWTD